MRVFLLIVVALVTFGLGAYIGMKPDSDVASADFHGYVLDQPRALPQFELQDQDGSTFTRENFKGDWSLIYFGYTYCPDICPSSLAEMSVVKEILDAESTVFSDQYYLVSVDPRRDSSKRLKEYVEYFDPDFRGVSGEVDQINLLTQAAGVVYQVPDATPDEEYLVGHSSTITLINPRGEVHAIFTTPLIAQNIAGDLRRIISDG